MSNIEQIFEPASLIDLQSRAQDVVSEGKLLRKMGVAVAVFNSCGEMLILEHEENTGNFPQGALGPSMETFRYLEGSDNAIESPYQAWLRSLQEELDVDKDMFESAGLYWGKNSVVSKNPWQLGVIEGQEVLADAFSMSVHITDSSVLTFNNRRSEEVLGTYFVDPEEILGSTDKRLRPGFLEWMQNMLSEERVYTGDNYLLEWQDLPVTGRDVIHPFSGSS